MSLEFIGRDKELKALQDRVEGFLDQAGRRQALWLHLTGEHGIGRTRLLEELIRSCRPLRELHRLRARDHGVHRLPYGTAASLLADDLKLYLWEGEYSKKEKLESRLAAFSALDLPRGVFEAGAVLPVLGQLLGVGYPLEFLTGIPRPGKGRLQVFNAVRRYLQAIRAASSRSEEQPLLLVLWVDDLEQADRLSLELLVHLVQKKDSLWPLLILTSATRSFSGELGYLSEFQEFSLSALSRHSRRKLVQALEAQSSPGAAPGPHLQKALVEGAPGNPEVILELWRLLTDRQSEGGGGGNGRRGLMSLLESKSRALEAIDLPVVLRERLRRLAPERRAVLQAVALLGPYCSFEFLTGLMFRTGQPPQGLGAQVRELAAEGLLSDESGPAPDGGTIKLCCPLAYGVVRESIPPDKLAALHQQVAELFHDTIEEEGRDLVFAATDQLLEAFFLREEWTVELLSACGDRLLALEDYPAAVRIFEEAVARHSLRCALEESEAGSIQLQRLCALLVRSGRARLGENEPRGAMGPLNSALQLSRALGLRSSQAEACLELGEIMVLRGDWDGAERFFEEGRQAAQAQEDVLLNARCLIAAGRVHLRREDWPGAGPVYRQALELCRRAGDPDRLLEALLDLGFIGQQVRDFESAEGCYQEALELAGRRRDEGAAVTALSNLGRIRYEQGRVDEALEYFHRALEHLRLLGDLQQTGNWLGYIGSVYYSMEEYETAIDYYRQALSLAERTGNLRGQSVWLANLGNAHYEIKELGNALDRYRQALALAREDQDYSYVSTLLSTLGVYYYNLKQYDLAQQHFSESLSLALEQGNLPIVVQDILYRGAILGHGGDREGARAALAEGEALALEAGLTEHRAVAELFRAQLALAEERYEDARGHCEKAARLAAGTGNRKLIEEIERAGAACRKGP